MLSYKNKKIALFFGQASEAFIPHHIKDLSPQCVANALCLNTSVDGVYFAHQVHGVHGYLIEQHHKATFKAFTSEGDFLITQQAGYGIAVATADCLPLILYHPFYNVLAVAHIGWRGAAGGIISSLLTTLHEQYGFSFDQLQAFIGPCAGVCCYQVQQDFAENFFTLPEQCLEQRGEQFYFSLLDFVKYELMNFDIQNINNDFAYCTLCTPNFCSYRKTATNQRQFTIAVLH